MKLIIFATVLIFGVGYAENDGLSEKNLVRLELKEAVGSLICSDIQDCCPKPLTAEQREFAIVKADELIQCINVTVDRFIDIADDDLTRNDFLSIDNIRKYVIPICEVFDKAFGCFRNIIPALDMCLSDRDMIFKNKVVTILPLVHSTLCLNNGSLVSDILEYADGLQCLSITAEWIGKSGASELLFRDTAELFGTERDCREFNTLSQETNAQLGHCSSPVLNLVRRMLNHFCDGTKCKRFINDLQCY